MIVIDEAAGQWITLVPALYLLGLNPLFTALALLFFRIFDILKPWPISYIDKKMSGPLSVMGDDILAGLISAGLLTGIIHYAGLG